MPHDVGKQSRDEGCTQSDLGAQVGLAQGKNGSERLLRKVRTETRDAEAGPSIKAQTEVVHSMKGKCVVKTARWQKQEEQGLDPRQRKAQRPDGLMGYRQTLHVC